MFVSTRVVTHDDRVASSVEELMTTPRSRAGSWHVTVVVVVLLRCHKHR